VIVCDFDDGRLFPLTDGSYPKSLLPIANRKLLAYQLDLLAKSGVQGNVFFVH
jgi:NDP-sugar pyrophosphorylase family protein